MGQSRALFDILCRFLSPSFSFEKIIVKPNENVAHVVQTSSHAWAQSQMHMYFTRVPLKGLGHAILGNFSTDQMVIELTKISK